MLREKPCVHRKIINLRTLMVIFLIEYDSSKSYNFLGSKGNCHERTKSLSRKVRRRFEKVWGGFCAGEDEKNNYFWFGGFTFIC